MANFQLQAGQWAYIRKCAAPSTPPARCPLAYDRWRYRSGIPRAVTFNVDCDPGVAR